MLAKIQKWGNSQGLRISRALLSEVKLDVGDEVDISVKEGTVVVAPVKRMRGRHTLQDLVARMPENAPPGEVDWGGSAGKEVW